MARSPLDSGHSKPTYTLDCDEPAMPVAVVTAPGAVETLLGSDVRDDAGVVRDDAAPVDGVDVDLDVVAVDTPGVDSVEPAMSRCNRLRAP